jgi:hypothetical protein
MLFKIVKQSTITKIFLKFNDKLPVEMSCVRWKLNSKPQTLSRNDVNYLFQFFLSLTLFRHARHLHKYTHAHTHTRTHAHTYARIRTRTYAHKGIKKYNQLQ